jgi:hypothetical protein
MSRAPAKAGVRFLYADPYSACAAAHPLAQAH